MNKLLNKETDKSKVEIDELLTCSIRENINLHESENQ